MTAERPVQQGRQARRRIVLTPETPPAEGTQVTLTITPETLADLFLNEPTAPFSVTFTWPAAGSGPVVIQDSVAPRIDQILLESGLLEIQLSEPIDLATTDAIEIDGQTDTWTQLEDGYTIRSTTPLAAGPHTLTVSTALQDFAGTGLAEPFEQSFSQEAGPATAQSQAKDLVSTTAPATTGSILVYGRPPADQVDLDTLSFLYGFHGRPRDLETGFVYFRNRYYDPDLGRFITADPLGYVDGPSQYIFVGYDPVNLGDPLGLYLGYTTPEQAKEAAGIGRGRPAVPGEVLNADFKLFPVFETTSTERIYELYRSRAGDPSLPFDQRLQAGINAATLFPFAKAEKMGREMLNAPHHRAEAVEAEAAWHRRFEELRRTGLDWKAAEDEMIALGYGPLPMQLGMIPLLAGRLPKGTPVASSSRQGALIREHLRQVEKYGAGGFRELESGRIRYYGALTPASKPGPMAGRRVVREWDPATGQTRVWMETLDHHGRVRIARPQTGAEKIHYMFDESGNLVEIF